MNSNLIKEAKHELTSIEGFAEWLLATVLAVLTILGNLSVAHGTLYLTLLAAVKSARVGLLRVVSLQKSVGLPAPAAPAAALTDTLNEIAQVRQAVFNVQAAPGTPVEQVANGLSPNDPPVPAAVPAPTTVPEPAA